MFIDDLHPHVDDIEAHFARTREFEIGCLIARAHRARSLAFYDAVGRLGAWLNRIIERIKAACYGAYNRSTRESARSF